MGNRTRTERVMIMDAVIDNVSMSEALDVIEAFVEERKPRLVVTANVDHLMLLRRDASFRAVYQQADLVTCDSIPLKWALWFLGRPLKERVAGADLLFTASARAAQRRWRLFLLGAAPGVAEKAKAALERLYDGISIIGTYTPPITPLANLLRDEAIKNRIRDAKPDVLFVAFGAPKQELWLNAVREELGVPVSIGVGAALDFAAGTVRRAPLWIQNAGLEWLWRLFQEPKRLWRRYFFVDARFVFFVLIEKARSWRRGRTNERA